MPASRRANLRFKVICQKHFLQAAKVTETYLII